MKEFKKGDIVDIAGCPVHLIITGIDSQGNYHLKRTDDDFMSFVFTPSELNKAYV